MSTANQELAKAVGDNTKLLRTMQSHLIHLIISRYPEAKRRLHKEFYLVDEIGQRDSELMASSVADRKGYKAMLKDANMFPPKLTDDYERGREVILSLHDAYMLTAVWAAIVDAMQDDSYSPMSAPNEGRLVQALTTLAPEMDEHGTSKQSFNRKIVNSMRFSYVSQEHNFLSFFNQHMPFQLKDDDETTQLYHKFANRAAKRINLGLVFLEKE